MSCSMQYNGHQQSYVRVCYTQFTKKSSGPDASRHTVPCAWNVFCSAWRTFCDAWNRAFLTHNGVTQKIRVLLLLFFFLPLATGDGFVLFHLVI